MKQIINLETTKPEKITTKTTLLGNGMYGCRVFYDGKGICETRVKKLQISSAYKGMLRMLDKCGYDSKMAHASRHRDNHMPICNAKVIWL